MGVYVVIGIVALVVQIVISIKFAGIAEDKGYDGTPYGFLCFFLGVIGYCMVAALPDLKAEEQRREILAKLNKLESPDPQAAPAQAKKAATLAPAPTQKIADGATVHAEIRDGEKVCPKCGTAQTAERKVCWSCGARFDN